MAWLASWLYYISHHLNSIHEQMHGGAGNQSIDRRMVQRLARANVCSRPRGIEKPLKRGPGGIENLSVICIHVRRPRLCPPTASKKGIATSNQHQIRQEERASASATGRSVPVEALGGVVWCDLCVVCWLLCVVCAVCCVLCVCVRVCACVRVCVYAPACVRVCVQGPCSISNTIYHHHHHHHQHHGP